MKKFFIGMLITLVILGLIGFSLVRTIVGTRDTLIVKKNATESGKSLTVSAVENCVTQMKTVWDMAKEEGLLEKGAYTEIAQARSGLMQAQEAFAKAKEDSGTSTTALQKIISGFTGSSGTLANVRVAFEAYPQLKTAEVYKKAMAVVSEDMQTIKTAMDDWIVDCENYNNYRGSTFTSLWCNLFFGDEFPKKIEYYTGTITDMEHHKVDISDIKPG